MFLTLLKSSQFSPPKTMLNLFFVAAKIFINTNPYLRNKPSEAVPLN